MKLTVFGIGYVGLVQAAILAQVGHEVICVDVDQSKIDNLKQAQIPIYEPGLDELIAEGVRAGRLHFTTDAEEGVRHGLVQFIAVGTPPDEDGSADLQYVLQVAETIARSRTEPVILVNKSTVPVGTAQKVKDLCSQILTERGESFKLEVVSNPEFLKEGSAVEDCRRPDRIVIGTDSDWALELMQDLYAPFNRNHQRILSMDLRSAELTKYAANSMLATKISFMNEIANLAECLGADVEMVRQGIGSDPRIGYHFIYPGCGYGGSCFPKDVKALIRTAQEADYHSELLHAVEKVNGRQKQKLFGQINDHFCGDLQGKTIALWGLSFKPNTDDMREAPSRELMESLWKAGARVQAFDPQAMKEAQRLYGHDERLMLMGTQEAALRGADALVICTDWQSFKVPDFELILRQLNHPVIFDGRNLYEPSRMQQLGFEYYGVGRGIRTRRGN
ncbi:UDP-glucose dehydrogenase family protein [Dongshaea marina]|uniref:UDP-glucose dehydrogenase family protein n=1 Tax=Dongshaea marina TaxID=2047966 RepID=UPI000D3ED6AB|nr:UDP-glucose/GDP-mannose dehydrogenase family protein [Dongshaea marina]